MDTSARKAGIFLILTAALTVVAVIGRVAADADQSTLAESIAAISDSALLYGIGGLGRLVSGITLVVGAWMLLSTWIIRERFATPLVPILLIVSGGFTLISGACAIILTAADPNSINTTTETVATLRWLTGKLGFTAAGAALVIAARYQWIVGGVLRRIAPAGFVLGMAMFLIWIDLGTTIHGVIGTIFFLWLLAVGTMLSTGRTERLFVEKFDLQQSG